jgi:hypothetical protein
MHGELFLFNWPTKFSLVEVIELGGGLDAPGIGKASKEGGARTGGGMAVCAGRTGRENANPTDFSPLGGVDILDKAMTIANSCHNSNPGSKNRVVLQWKKSRSSFVFPLPPIFHSRLLKS